MRGRLKVPLKLTVVALAAGLSGCPADKPQASNLCPGDYYCTTDAARAFNCTDAAPMSDPVDIITDLGACYAPV